MENDFNNVFSKFNEMMNNGEIPENVKSILQNMVNSNNMNNSNNSNNTSNTINTNNKNNTNSTNNTRTTNNAKNNNNTNNPNNSNNSNIFNNIDINTFFKLQNAMNSINSDKQNESRTNLLLSLKPYLKESRRGKVDQYVQLFKMEKVFEIINPLGGDKKNV